MTATLFCYQGRRRGSAMILRPGRSLRIRLRIDGAVAGVLHIRDDNGRITFQNSSQIPSMLNGVVAQSGSLEPGDRLTCGEHGFELSEGDAIAAQELTSCDLEHQLASPMELAERASRSRTETEPPSPAVVPHLSDDTMAGDDKNDSGRRRGGRRLSASRRAVVLRRRGGLLRRMGIVREDERMEQLRQLESERDHLLRIAGRRALEHQGGFGLPAGILAELSAGRSQLVSEHQLRQEELEHFQLMHRELRMLDAEIMSLRSELGMPMVDDVDELWPKRFSNGALRYSNMDEAEAAGTRGDTRVLSRMQVTAMRAGRAQ